MVPPPADYDPRTFELYRRGFQNKAKIDVGRRMRKLGELEACGGRIHSIGAGNLAGETNPDDSVGLASYGVDEWPYATYPLDGKVALNGGYFSMLYLEETHQGIYKIPYRAITPKQDECANLLVPVCVSASHIAMTSIRMEPVWMILGESAGVAAAQALAQNVAVQAIDATRYRKALLEVGQILEWPGSAPGKWNSREEWNKDKRGYEWLFPAIDKDKDGKISAAEYKEFQAFKQKHPDWQKLLRAKSGEK